MIICYFKDIYFKFNIWRNFSLFICDFGIFCIVLWYKFIFLIIIKLYNFVGNLESLFFDRFVRKFIISDILNS